MEYLENVENNTEIAVLRKSTPKILIVEDEQLVRWSLSLALSKAGFDITTVNNGENAIQSINSSRYDLVITDLDLPVRNGYAVALQVKKASPETPVILTSAVNEKDSKIAFNNLDIEAFVEKPYDLSQFTDLVKQLLSRKDNNGK